MKLLIGTDGSDEAVQAANTAIGLVAAPETVVIVCVVEAAGAGTEDLGSGFGSSAALDPAEIEQGWERTRAVASEAIERTVQALQLDANVERVVEHGDAGLALCRLAEEREADLVVVGSRGRGAFKRALLGSVSSHVVNNSPCPVLVVRRGTAPGDESG